ncbi:MAG: hypothetical protein K6E20_04980 [Acholeplasmatales bacterium]|nr:hypothetical protein [Acholeplasmatales bacterium]
MFYNRIKDIICHPSRIGLYFKDKVYVIIIHLVLFMGLLFGVAALDSLYKPNSFGRNDSIDISETISNYFDSSKEVVEYKNYKMSGTSELSSGNFTLYVNREIADKNITTYVLVFSEDKVSGYFKGSKEFDEAYSNLDSDYSFTFENISKNNTKDKISFVEFLTPIIEEYEQAHANYIFLTNVGTIIVYYIALLIAMFIFSLLANPVIASKIRIKLVIYDSLIFFVVSSISVLFGATFLMYLALIMAVFYSNITFSHIIKVKVKKG